MMADLGLLAFDHTVIWGDSMSSWDMTGWLRKEKPLRSGRTTWLGVCWSMTLPRAFFPSLFFLYSSKDDLNGTCPPRHTLRATTFFCLQRR